VSNQVGWFWKSEFGAIEFTHRMSKEKQEELNAFPAYSGPAVQAPVVPSVEELAKALARASNTVETLVPWGNDPVAEKFRQVAYNLIHEQKFFTLTHQQPSGVPADLEGIIRKHFNNMPVNFDRVAEAKSLAREITHGYREPSGYSDWVEAFERWYDEESAKAPVFYAKSDGGLRAGWKALWDRMTTPPPSNSETSLMQKIVAGYNQVRPGCDCARCRAALSSSEVKP